jgi:hypothetical protein
MSGRPRGMTVHMPAAALARDLQALLPLRINTVQFHSGALTALGTHKTYAVWTSARHSKRTNWQSQLGSDQRKRGYRALPCCSRA